MKLESEKAGVILGFIGVSWVSRGTLGDMSKGRMFVRGYMVVPVLLEEWHVFTIEEITILPETKQRSNRRGYHSLNHKGSN